MRAASRLPFAWEPTSAPPASERLLRATARHDERLGAAMHREARVNIVITFRQMEATEAMKQYATEKVAKLQRFLRRPMKGQVTLSCQQKLHRADVDIHAGGDHYHAHEASEDMYASVDKVVDKLERQIRAAHEASAARKKGGDRASDHLLPALEESGDE